MENIFRKAIPADAPAMAALLTCAWQKAYRGILSDALLDGINAEERSGWIRSAIETKPEFKYFVLETNGDVAGVAGVCSCQDEDLPEASEIVVFYIRPDLQGHGLGREMMRRTLEEISPSENRPVALWVLRDNHSARAFYERVGFQADGAVKTLPNLEDAATVRYVIRDRIMRLKDFNIIVFDGFETLDAMGPAEIIGSLPDAFNLRLCSAEGGLVISAQNLCVDTAAFASIKPGGVLLIPGGIGTRQLVGDPWYIGRLRALALDAETVLTVCTGSALFSKTGLLDGRKATSNKKLFSWAQAVNPNVRWRRQARWVIDGKFYTSSGVTAGMDMTLGFIRDTVGYDAAKTVAENMEYLWNEDKDSDPFAK
jgi:putative intracellular protease/amidase/GNAT superfamily N-acetyltransferase